MTIEEIKAQMATMLETGKKENRSLNTDEMKQYETLKAELATVEHNAKKAMQSAVAESQTSVKSNAAEYIRSITKGSADVGNKEVTAQVVEAFSTLSPLFASHGNVQSRSTGNTFSFTKFTTANGGAVKGELAESDTDTDTAATIESVAFKTYRSKKVPISQEAIDDFAADIVGEITKIGLVRSVRAFNVDCFKRITEAFGAVYNGSDVLSTPADYDASSATAWAVADLIALYFALPVEKRNGAKWICNSETAIALIDLMDLEDSAKIAFVGLSKDNIVVDDACADDVLYYGNPTLILAIGRKDPVKMQTLPVDGGYTYEAQPRLAVALADPTAVVALELKAS